jgi:hypothetical protein
METILPCARVVTSKSLPDAWQVDTSLGAALACLSERRLTSAPLPKPSARRDAIPRDVPADKSTGCAAFPYYHARRVAKTVTAVSTRSRFNLDDDETCAAAD